MDLSGFIETYDHKGVVILLLGKRKVIVEDSDKLVQFAQKLTKMTKHITFRSGNASGADELFKLGVSSVDSQRIELVTPYKGHRNKSSSEYNIISLDSIDLISEPDIIYYSKLNKKNIRIIDRYLDCYKDKFAMKGAYLLRDTLMVVGAKRLNIPKANFAIFYDDLLKPNSGGTGHTMNVCDSLKISFINQKVWMKWI